MIFGFPVNTDGVFCGGLIGSLEFVKILTFGGIGRATGATVMSAPLQPSGKKYLMFSLLCWSSLKSPMKDAFLKSNYQLVDYLSKLKSRLHLSPPDFG